MNEEIVCFFILKVVLKQIEFFFKLIYFGVFI
jgi:hypothetical protein